MENLQYRPEFLISEKKLRNKTIVSFVIFFALLTAAVIGWNKIREQPKVAGVPTSVRSVLDENEIIFANFLSNNHIARQYPVTEAVKNVRVNGDLGMGNNFNPNTWKLQVVRKPGDTLFLSLDDIKALPKTDIIFDFKCIEGWSQVTHWAGARFSDFAAKYNLTPQSQMKYVSLVTPDKQYYVGIDMASMMHPQTILCYEMNGKPLPMNQGYPLRLIIPVKYGIKHLKRIGTMSFSNERPPDYWYERGYDYFSGL